MSVVGEQDSLSGARVLLVEDEMLITMLLEDILDELGCKVVGSAVNLRQAEDLAATAEADAAILDVNLGGEPVFSVAEALIGRKIPFIFASGYGSANLPEKWQNCPTLPKPFTSDQVADTLRAVLNNRSALA